MVLKKILKIIGITLVSIISFLIIALVIVGCLEKQIYSDFFSKSEEIVSIYGLEDGYIPQGFTYSQEKDVFLTSGYINKGVGPSRIYQISSDNKEHKYVTLKNEDDTPFMGHCGGIGAYKNSVYIACDDENYNKIFEFSLQDIINAENGSSVKVKSSRKLDVNPAYICVYNDIILVGEFYKKDSYETKSTHHITTPGGEENPALCYAYDANTFEKKYVLSVPSLVQGIVCYGEGKFAISTSWAISSSHLYFYENVFVSKDSFDNLDLFFLDSTKLTKTVKLPPMSEEIQLYNNKILVNFESAGDKYKMVNLFRQTSVWGYNY